MDEPDFGIWEPPTPHTICILSRRDMGHLCGYAGIRLPTDDQGLVRNLVKNNLLIKEVSRNNHKVHGGVTFTGEGSKIQLPEEVDEDWVKSYFFLGFDCAHHGDLCFLFSKYTRPESASLKRTWPVYRDWDYCKSQCESLAEQMYYSCQGVYLG